MSDLIKITLAVAAKHDAALFRALMDAAIDNVDEIVVAVDNHAEQGIEGYRRDKVTYLRRSLATDRTEPDFAAQYNYLLLNSHCPWVLHLDTDETLTTWFWQHLRIIVDSTIEETITLPFRNHIVGIQDYMSWPDYKLRLLRKNNRMRWHRKVHQILLEVATTRTLPPEDRYAVQHIKTMEQQLRSDAFEAAHPLRE